MTDRQTDNASENDFEATGTIESGLISRASVYYLHSDKLNIPQYRV